MINQGVDLVILPDVALLVHQLLMMMPMVTQTKSKSKNFNLQQATLPSVQAVRGTFEDGASEEELRGTLTLQNRRNGHFAVFNALESHTNMDGFSIFSISA